MLPAVFNRWMVFMVPPSGVDEMAVLLPAVDRGLRRR